MAAIFRPTYTRLDPATGERVQKGLRKWYVEYVNAQGIRQSVPGYVDKEATRQLAAQLEKRSALEAVGVVDPYLEHRRRPLRSPRVQARSSRPRGRTARAQERRRRRMGSSMQ